MVLEACIAERCGASARSKIPARRVSRSGRESKYTRHVPCAQQNPGHDLAGLYLGKYGVIMVCRRGVVLPVDRCVVQYSDSGLDFGR